MSEKEKINIIFIFIKRKRTRHWSKNMLINFYLQC